MMSILTLALMIIMVATMRPAGGSMGGKPNGTAKSKKKRGDTLILGRGVRVGPPERDPNNPGVVSYRLMDDNKLPSATQRALRRMTRPFSRASLWINRRFSTPKPDDSTAKKRGTAESIELQNFLEARNREIARRKSEDPSKRGPEDTLH